MSLLTKDILPSSIRRCRTRNKSEVLLLPSCSSSATDMTSVLVTNAVYASRNQGSTLHSTPSSTFFKILMLEVSSWIAMARSSRILSFVEIFNAAIHSSEVCTLDGILCNANSCMCCICHIKANLRTDVHSIHDISTSPVRSLPYVRDEFREGVLE